MSTATTTEKFLGRESQYTCAMYAFINGCLDCMTL
jgi:hypothetical protein